MRRVHYDLAFFFVYIIVLTGQCPVDISGWSSMSTTDDSELRRTHTWLSVQFKKWRVYMKNTCDEELLCSIKCNEMQTCLLTRCIVITDVDVDTLYLIIGLSYITSPQS